METSLTAQEERVIVGEGRRLIASQRTVKKVSGGEGEHGGGASSTRSASFWTRRDKKKTILTERWGGLVNL